MVERGELLGLCGNSGNSTLPHLHFQPMDHPRALIAAGLPFVFTRTDDAAGPREWLPRNGEIVGAATEKPSSLVQGAG